MRLAQTRTFKATTAVLLCSAMSAVTIVAQDAMVMSGVIGGGSSLPPGVAPGAAPAPAAAPAASPIASPMSAPAPSRASAFSPAPLAAPATPTASAYAPVSGGSALPPTPAAPSSVGTYTPPAAPAYAPPVQAAWTAPAVERKPVPAESRGYYPGRVDKGQGYAQPSGSGLRGPQATPDFDPATIQLAQVSGGSSLPPGSPYPPGVGGSSVPPTASPPARPRSWAERMGLGNISTRLFGHVKAGAGARDEDLGGVDDDWEETVIADAFLGAEVSAITSGGLEYGARLELRGAYDADSTLLGGLVGDCPTGFAACPGQINLNGQGLALRGHTSQLFTGADEFQDDERVVLEAAHLFARTAYGDITLGRDVGAAELFSLGAPSLLELGGNNGRADYTSLSVATTVNAATGYAPKVTYTTPRLGGDQIGVGIQLGASYTPDVNACGVYQCFRRNGSDRAAGSLGAVLEDAFEAGLSLERTLGEAKIEVTGTYATASHRHDGLAAESLAAFDDLSSWGLGAEATWRGLTLGGSYLSSNNALADGDYTGWDAGLTYRFGPDTLGGLADGWGVTLGYASAEDDNVRVESDEYLAGIQREFGDGFSLGAGLQYIERTVPVATGATLATRDESATALFVEGGWEF